MYWGEWKFTRHVWERTEGEDDNKLTLIQSMVMGDGASDAVVDMTWIMVKKNEPLSSF